MKANNSGDFRVMLHAQSADLPPIVRLRQLLKVALRSYGFRCVALEQILPVPVEQLGDERPEEVKAA
jgi:hypothetical protein